MKFEIDQNERKLKEMFSAADHEIRFVGGSVRDWLRGEEPKDKDFCTDATPDEMIAIAKQHSVTVVPTGLQHGTVTFVINHVPYEITTLRIDTDTDGRHAEVEFTRDFKLDAERRDLTINAMSMDFDGNLYDYFGGQEDLKNNVVRFVGDAGTRIREDYLRILRYFRFAARFNSEMDMDTLDTIRFERTGLQKISKERIWLEMSKLFVAQARGRVFKVMQLAGVDAEIGLPPLKFAVELQSAECAEAAVAMFFKGNGDAARAFCNGWKMSAAETNKAAWIAANYFNLSDRDAIMDWLNDGVDRDYVYQLARIHWDDRGPTAGLDHFAQSYEVVTFPVKGQDLLDRGMAPGKEMGQALKAMRVKWIESRYTLTRDELLEG